MRAMGCLRAVGLSAVLMMAAACSDGGGEPFGTPEEAEAHFEQLSREFAKAVVEGDLDGAYERTARELQRDVEREEFDAEVERAFALRGRPKGIRNVRIDTADPGVLIEEIMGFPASVRPESRRAATVVTLATEQGVAEMELFFSGKLREEGVAAFKVR